MELCWDYLHKESVFYFTVRHIHLEAGCMKMQADLCLFFFHSNHQWLGFPWKQHFLGLFSALLRTWYSSSHPLDQLDCEQKYLEGVWMNWCFAVTWVFEKQSGSTLQRMRTSWLCVPAISDFICYSPAFLHSKLIMICIMLGLAAHRKNTSCNGYVCLLYIFLSVRLARISAF